MLLVRRLLSLTLFLLILLLGKKSDLDMEKQAPFECGFLSYEERRCPFSTHFFIVGLIFDVERIKSRFWARIIGDLRIFLYLYT